MDELIERLRNFEGSDALGNGDFSLLHEAAAALEAAQQRIACLPADWREDSSLETWFPFTAKQLAAAQQRIAELERELENERARAGDC